MNLLTPILPLCIGTPKQANGGSPANDGISSEHRLKTLMRGRARLKKKESQLLRTVNYLVVRVGAFYVCSNVRVIDSLSDQSKQASQIR